MLTVDVNKKWGESLTLRISYIMDIIAKRAILQFQTPQCFQVQERAQGSLVTDPH